MQRREKSEQLINNQSAIFSGRPSLFEKAGMGCDVGLMRTVLVGGIGQEMRWRWRCGAVEGFRRASVRMPGWDRG